MDRKPFAGTFERIDEFFWAIPPEFMKGMRVPGIIVTSHELLEDVRSDQAPRQVANVATLPGIVGASFAMPDIHWGFGFPIGGVAAMRLDEGVVSPGGIGYDINCGIRLLRSDLRAGEVGKGVAKLLDAVFSKVPAGVGSSGAMRLSVDDERAVCRKGAQWCVGQGKGWAEDVEATEEAGMMPDADWGEVSERARERGRGQLGTLGSGNHFIEIQRVEEVFDPAAAAAFGLFPGQLTVMIHSGSRGLGYQVCEDFLGTFGRALGKYHMEVPDNQLACAPIGSEEGRRYLRAMSAAANWAFANREIMTNSVRDAFEGVLGASARKLGLSLVYDHCHNIAKTETHMVDGTPRRLLVHRKGATRSLPAGHPDVPERYRSVGQPVLLPGSMGTCSYVMAGLPGAMERTFGSTSHGAGRRMSRHAAVKAARGRRIDRELEGRGIAVRANDLRGLAEEMPDAYKDVEDIAAIVAGAGLARPVAKLVPLGVVKG